MILFRKTADIHHFLTEKKVANLQLGFVPTMGALHAGHLSLIKTAAEQTDITICSIFVNPSQFNDPADFEKYPITIENDIYLLEKAGCDILFLPSVDEIYPNGVKNKQHYDIGYLETILEGKYRPGHFQGVCQVVHRLLEIIPADRLYLGQKDFQQCMVVKKLIELTNINVMPVVCSIIREENGLAMSSRNMRLSIHEKEQAVNIYQILSLIKKEIKAGPLSLLKQKATDYLSEKGFTVDYVEIANADTLASVDQWDGKTQLVVLCAAFLGNVRLIDNMLLN